MQSIIIMNKIIELKKIEDSFASAANYLNKIGWDKNKPCFVKDRISKRYSKKIFKFFSKKYKK